MSNVALFALGAVVTLLVGGAITLLVWGAILDGRYDHERRAALGVTDPDTMRSIDAAA
jgi:hypothetical protein